MKLVQAITLLRCCLQKKNRFCWISTKLKPQSWHRREFLTANYLVKRKLFNANSLKKCSKNRADIGKLKVLSTNKEMQFSANATSLLCKNVTVLAE
jgi:hypothetical protein